MLDLVDESDGVVLIGDVAFPLCVADEVVGAEAEFTGAFARSYLRRRAEERPVDVLAFAAVDVQRITALGCLAKVCRGEPGLIHQLLARRHLEAAGTAHDDQSPYAGAADAGDQTTGGVAQRRRRQIRLRVWPRRDGADDDVGPTHR